MTTSFTSGSLQIPFTIDYSDSDNTTEFDILLSSTISNVEFNIIFNVSGSARLTKNGTTLATFSNIPTPIPKNYTIAICTVELIFQTADLTYTSIVFNPDIAAMNQISGGCTDSGSSCSVSFGDVSICPTRASTSATSSSNSSSSQDTSTSFDWGIVSIIIFVIGIIFGICALSVYGWYKFDFTEKTKDWYANRFISSTYE
jgi:hypothetical protein